MWRLSSGVPVISSARRAAATSLDTNSVRCACGRGWRGGKAHGPWWSWTTAHLAQSRPQSSPRNDTSEAPHSETHAAALAGVTRAAFRTEVELHGLAPLSG
jgi:hypothetical protein